MCSQERRGRRGVLYGASLDKGQVDAGENEGDEAASDKGQVRAEGDEVYSARSGTTGPFFLWGSLIATPQQNNKFLFHFFLVAIISS